MRQELLNKKASGSNEFFYSWEYLARLKVEAILQEAKKDKRAKISYRIFDEKLYEEIFGEDDS